MGEDVLEQEVKERRFTQRYPSSSDVRLPPLFMVPISSFCSTFLGTASGAAVGSVTAWGAVSESQGSVSEAF